MGTWTDRELQSFSSADDFYISPYRDDGVTYGTPTFIWSVVADGELYVRPYNGADSRWYRSAMTQGGGCIRILGVEHEVEFAPADAAVFDTVDDAYRTKYTDSPYLPPMIAEGPRVATVRVTPKRS
ncbi:DUF2255 family protein [Corynebacterium glyciniphilum]|uniref:DUF2255 family protein n=1 Tax=Corynebacterium glyciniphilum TaxID=1404244 RepID=UPI003DA1B6B0